MPNFSHLPPQQAERARRLQANGQVKRRTPAPRSTGASVRLSQREADLISRAARARGESLSGYQRRVLLAQAAQDAPPPEVVAQAVAGMQAVLQNKDATPAERLKAVLDAFQAVGRADVAQQFQDAASADGGFDAPEGDPLAGAPDEPAE